MKYQVPKVAWPLISKPPYTLYTFSLKLKIPLFSSRFCLFSLLFHLDPPPSLTLFFILSSPLSPPPLFRLLVFVSFGFVPLFPPFFFLLPLFSLNKVMTFEDLKELGDEEAVKKAGKLRQQGKKYVVQDADVIFFKVGRARIPTHRTSTFSYSTSYIWRDACLPAFDTSRRWVRPIFF